ARVVSACPAIEIIHSRFIDFNLVTHCERIADHFVNGAFVRGAPRRDLGGLDLSKAHVTLTVDGIVVIDAIGGHPANDPILPVVDLANHFRNERGLKAGETVTTGSFTGLVRVTSGQTVRATFDGLGSVQARFTR
ncbi:MAG TPA: hypothetical protein VFT30_07495, partial [Nitrospira sp.]|nr:hypothetical protein [Nitrospira sp.]